MDKQVIDKKMSFEIDFLKKQKYCFVDIPNKYSHYLAGVFQLIDEAWKDPAPKISRLTKEGYTFYDGPSLPNVLYVSNFKEEHIAAIKKYLIETEVKKNLEKLFNSNIGVCNIRAYRFTHDPPREKTHYLDLLDENSKSFNAHRDGLLQGTLKMMIFKAKGEEKVTLQHGALEICPNGQWISIVGDSPIAAIFPPNIVLHRALQPAPNKIRDAIELTIIKRKANDFLVESCGAHAGHPKDLNKWNEIE